MPEVGDLTKEGAAEGRFDNWGEVVTRQPYRKVRLDHLLSKEISKGCCLLFSHQGLSAAQDCKNEEANLFAESFETGMRHVKA